MTRHRRDRPDRRVLGSSEEQQGFVNPVNVHPFVYVGVVMDNRDAMRMGRLRVWVPEISGEAGRFNPTKWVVAEYVSPFAGATDWARLEPRPRDWTRSQQAYGLWVPAPDLGNEVLVAFIGGDPNRAVWFACRWPVFANHGVPGLAAGPTDASLTESCGELPPTVEVNRSPPESEEPEPVGDFYGDPERPRFEPLHEGLWHQGLYGDYLRGNADAGARRESPSRVLGITSLRGHHIVIDDGRPELDEDGREVFDGTQRRVLEGSPEYIRLRTRGGTQVLISDTDGFVYVISRQGNSWLEIGDDGIAVYTLRDLSLRVQGNMNLRVDGDFNLETGGDVRIRATHGMRVTSEGHIALASVDGRSDCAGEPGISLYSDDFVGIHAERDVLVRAEGEAHRSAGERIVDVAPRIDHNGAQARRPPPTPTLEASPRLDRELDPETCYPPTRLACDSFLPQKAIVTHEPWAHPRTTALPPEPAEGVEFEPDEPEPEPLGDPVEDCARWGAIVDTLPVTVPIGDGDGVLLEPGAPGRRVAGVFRPLRDWLEAYNFENADNARARALIERLRDRLPFLETRTTTPGGRLLVGWGTPVSPDMADWFEALPADRRPGFAEGLMRDRLAAAASALLLLAPSPDTVDQLQLTAPQFEALVALGYHDQSFMSRVYRRFVDGDWRGAVRTVGCAGLPVGTEVLRDEPPAVTDAPPASAPPPAGCPETPSREPSAEVRAAIDAAAAEFGVDRDYLYGAAYIESRFDPQAKAPSSSASGLFQITKPTWDRVVRKYNLPYTWADVRDPVANARVAAALTKDNAEALRRRLGREPTAGELYLGHLLGSRGAIDLARAPDDLPVDQALGPVRARWIAGNGYIFRDPNSGRLLRVGEVRQRVADLVACGSQWS